LRKARFMQKLSLATRQGLFHNILLLTGTQLTAYVFPLVTVPYLVRILGPDEWGKVIFTQAFGSYFGIILEYGFNLSAAREVARNRESSIRQGEVLAGVLGARALLLLLCTLIVLPIQWKVVAFRSDPLLIWSGLLWTLGRSCTFFWYYQGTERMHLAALLDAGANLLSTISILFWVRSPQDGWLALAMPGTVTLIASLASLTLICREVEFMWPNWKLTKEAFIMGWSLFLFRGAVSLYTSGNAFILGIFATSRDVAHYAGAEKISKAFISLLTPFTQSIFPRLSRLVKSEPEKAAELARLSLLVMSAGGIGMGSIVYIFAPFWVRWFLGHEFAPAVQVLQLLALLSPLIAISNVLGIQWMLPRGLDRQFNAVIIMSGFINLSLAMLLSSRWGAIGMAVAVTASELAVTIGMYTVLKNRRLCSVKRSKPLAPEVV
jgi:polysaccharide transporter, PST family